MLQEPSFWVIWFILMWLATAFFWAGIIDYIYPIMPYLVLVLFMCILNFLGFFILVIIALVRRGRSEDLDRMGFHK
jgi:hypothetical protein